MPTDAITNNLAALIALLVYIVIRDFAIPRMKARNNKIPEKSGNPADHRDVELREKFAAFEARMSQWCEGQEDSNKRLEEAVEKVHERISKYHQPYAGSERRGR